MPNVVVCPPETIKNIVSWSNSGKWLHSSILLLTTTLQCDSKPVMKSVKSYAAVTLKTLFYCPTFLDNSDTQPLSSTKSTSWGIGIVKIKQKYPEFLILNTCSNFLIVRDNFLYLHIIIWITNSFKDMANCSVQIENGEFTLIHYLLKIIPLILSTPLFVFLIWNELEQWWMRHYCKRWYLKTCSPSWGYQKCSWRAGLGIMTLDGTNKKQCHEVEANFLNAP